jgi:ABC-type transport system substrate-binding protein
VYDRLPYGDFAVVSPTAAQSGADINTAPVGAGPFMLDTLETGRLIRLKKNPDSFEADKIRFAAIEFIHVEPGQARVTAIQSNTVDPPPRPSATSRARPSPAPAGRSAPRPPTPS